MPTATKSGQSALVLSKSEYAAKWPGAEANANPYMNP
jgi:hypothetical protein